MRTSDDLGPIHIPVGMLFGSDAEAPARAMALLNHVEYEVRKKREIARSFDDSLENVRVAFQPIFEYPAGDIVGHEALLRSWDSTFTGPVDMLEQAETHDRVIELGRIVRREVANALRAGTVQRAFVNLHALDLTDPELGTDLDPLSEFADRVTLELTERKPIEMTPETRRRLAELKARGFSIAIDDLGSGYSSLSSAALVRPDVVKLDASLTRDIHVDVHRRRLVEALIGHYHQSRVRIVAEGIECEDELEALRSIGCNMIQGFLLGRPSFLSGS